MAARVANRVTVAQRLLTAALTGFRARDAGLTPRYDQWLHPAFRDDGRLAPAVA